MFLLFTCFNCQVTSLRSDSHRMSDLLQFFPPLQLGCFSCAPPPAFLMASRHLQQFHSVTSMYVFPGSRGSGQAGDFGLRQNPSWPRHHAGPATLYLPGGAQHTESFNPPGTILPLGFEPTARLYPVNYVPYAIQVPTLTNQQAQSNTHPPACSRQWSTR